MSDPERPIDGAVAPGEPLPVVDDHDSPWKDALELYFPQALALLAPDLHTAIDWSIAPDFLDKELQAIALPSKKGRGVRFTCPVVELEGWRDRWDELDRLASANPFAVVIMAQLQANRYRDKRTRLKPKLDLVRRLRHYGYDPVVAGQVYRLIEWMIALPQDLEPEYLQAVSALSEERNMTYVTLIERAALAKGHAEGRAEQLLGQVRRRFGPLSEDVAQRILSAQAAQLETWSLNILDAAELDDVFRD